MIDRRILLPAIAAAASLVGGPVARADQYDPTAAYYSTATGTGATLKNQLHTIVSTGVNQHSYDDNRIAGGLTDADPNNPNNLILVYNGASVPKVWDNGVTWNREHCWPDSHGLQSGG